MKDNAVDPNETGARNPYRILLHQLTGSQAQRPRLKTASNVWRRTHREEIERKVEAQATAEGCSRKKLAPLREKLSKEMFAALAKEEKEEWEQAAKNEHQEAIAKFEHDLKSPPSTNPADRQRYAFFLGLLF